VAVSWPVAPAGREGLFMLTLIDCKTTAGCEPPPLLVVMLPPPQPANTARTINGKQRKNLVIIFLTPNRNRTQFQSTANHKENKAGSQINFLEPSY
jgi:hypothetical protein